jgi:hypothetical protein
VAETINISDETLERLARKLMGEPDSRFDPNNAKTLNEFIKQMKKSTDELKKSQPGMKTFENIVRGVTDTGDAFKDVERDLQRLDKAIREATDANNVEAKSKLEAERAEKVSAAAKVQATRATANFAVGLIGVAGTMMKGALEFVQGLMSSASGVEIASRAAKNTVKAGFQLGEVFGQLMTAIGPFLLLITKLGVVGKVLGVAMTAAGIVIEQGSKKAADAAVQVIDTLEGELKRTQKAFSVITSTGAQFAGGMTEMRKQAARAGLDVEQFANVIKDSRSEMGMMGMGMSEATKRIAGISKEIQNPSTGLSIQLRKLGYNAEEQAKLIPSLMANLNAAGDKRIRTDKELAITTAAYGRDLKILASITGEDAAKAMEKARLVSLQADVLAQLEATGGPGAVLKFQRQMAVLPEGLKKGYLEFISSGGTVITDVATNVAMQTNEKILPQFQTMFGTLGDVNKNASMAQAEVTELTAQTAQYQRDHLGTMRDIAVAARLSGDPMLQSITDIGNGLILFNTKILPGAYKLEEDATDRARKSMDALGVAVHGLEDATQRLKAELTDKVTPLLAQFATGLKKSLETVEAAIKRLQAGLNEMEGKDKDGKDVPKGPSLMDTILKYAGIRSAQGTVMGGAIGLAGFGAGVIPGMGVGATVGLATGVVEGLVRHYMGTEAGTPLAGNITQTGKPDDPKRYAGLRVGGSYRGEAIAGGPAEERLIELAKKVQAMDPGGTFNAFNDTLPAHKGSKHGAGRALDFSLSSGKPSVDQGKAIVSAFKELGFSKVIDEYNFPSGPATGGHIHAELQDGGLVAPSAGGRTVRVGEGGQWEGVFPLNPNKPVPMMLNEDQFDKLIAVLKTQADTSDKILMAQL